MSLAPLNHFGNTLFDSNGYRVRAQSDWALPASASFHLMLAKGSRQMSHISEMYETRIIYLFISGVWDIIYMIVCHCEENLQWSDSQVGQQHITFADGRQTSSIVYIFYLITRRKVTFGHLWGFFLGKLQWDPCKWGMSSTLVFTMRSGPSRPSVWVLTSIYS